jgi:hypothetical protein
MPFKSVAQYHKLHKTIPAIAGRMAKETDLSKLPPRLTPQEGDRLAKFRGKVAIKTPTRVKKGK